MSDYRYDPWTEAEIEHARAICEWPDAIATLCHQLPHRNPIDIGEKVNQLRSEKTMESSRLEELALTDPAGSRTLAAKIEAEMRRPRTRHKLDE